MIQALYASIVSFIWFSLNVGWNILLIKSDNRAIWIEMISRKQSVLRTKLFFLVLCQFPSQAVYYCYASKHSFFVIVVVVVVVFFFTPFCTLYFFIMILLCFFLCSQRSVWVSSDNSSIHIYFISLVRYWVLVCIWRFSLWNTQWW